MNETNVKHLLRACAFASLALAALLGAARAKAQLLDVTVADGVLSGKTVGRVAAYLGVPFAAPPVGEHRWKPPAPPARWSGVRPAGAFGPSCQQALTPSGFGPWTHEYVVNGPVSEDCLYLNVWTPAERADEKLAVLVWIYGGGFTQGSASVPIYDGAALASRGIVVVSFNYRVGPYGFLAHPELTAESPNHASGNYGLLDQIAALHWVERNIARFGGDPSRVTIAGQSAGAASVHHLVASPLAKGLFARAIAESGSGMGLAVEDRATAEARGAQLAQAAGAASLADLRRLTPPEIETALTKIQRSGTIDLRFAPIVDGYALPSRETVGANTNDAPILTGMTANEMTGLDAEYGKATPASLDARIAGAYGAYTERIAALYPAADDAQANAAIDALARDRGLASLYLWAQNRLGASREPIYAYLWTHPEPGSEAARYKAFHSSEIPYVFGTFGASPERPFTAEDQALSELLGGYWVNWVKFGDPNGPGLPRWPRFTLDDPRILEIGTTSQARPILSEDKRDAFEGYVDSGGSIGLLN